MTEAQTEIERISERASGLVKEVAALEKRWPTAQVTDKGLLMEGELLLERLGKLADDVTPVFLDMPVTAINDARFGWACYEISNARLNLTYLLLFGVNQVTARRKSLIPKVQS